MCRKSNRFGNGFRSNKINRKVDQTKQKRKKKNWTNKSTAILALLLLFFTIFTIPIHDHSQGHILWSTFLFCHCRFQSLNKLKTQADLHRHSRQERKAAARSKFCGKFVFHQLQSRLIYHLKVSASKNNNKSVTKVSTSKHNKNVTKVSTSKHNKSTR